MRISWRVVLASLLGLVLCGSVVFLGKYALRTRQSTYGSLRPNITPPPAVAPKYPQITLPRRKFAPDIEQWSAPAQQHALLLPDLRQIVVDAIDVHVVCAGSGRPRFVKDSSVSERALYDATTQDLVSLWLALTLDNCFSNDSSMCWSPTFGMRLYSQQRRVFDVNLCWSCGEVEVETEQQTFTCRMDAKSDQAVRLRQKFASLFQNADALHEGLCGESSFDAFAPINPQRGGGIGNADGYGLLSHDNPSREVSSLQQHRTAALQVEPGNLAVRGSLPPEPVRSLVRSHVPEVKNCYANGLRDSPGRQGHVVLQITIGRDGSVSASSVQSTTLKMPIVEQCIATAARRWFFPSSRKGDAIVTVPITLKTGSTH